MRVSRQWLQALLATVTFGLTAVAWVAFAPTQFGGGATYVLVSGNSMEPSFHRNDLVILRQASDYQVGDIATYHHPDIGPVIHRIIAVEGDRFILKGDNNSWNDSYQPTRDDFIGKFWLYLPRGGNIVAWLRQPTGLALAAAGFVGAAGISATSRGQGRRRKSKHGRVGPVNSTRNGKIDLLVALAMLSLALLLLAAIAFTRPLARTVYDTIGYEQRGAFSYSAAAPPGLYTTDMVKTGEPVFRRLVTLVDVGFDYEFAATQPDALSGTYRLVVELGNSGGWRWTFDLLPETPFSGNSFSLATQLDLARVQTIIDNLEQQTGVTSQQYSLALVPRVAVSGTFAGQTVQDTFAPRLSFTIDALQLKLADPANPAAAGGQLQPSQTAQVKRPRQAPNTLSLLNLTSPVATVQKLSLGGLALCLLGLVSVGVPMARAARAGEPERIATQYGSLLVTIRGNDLPASRQGLQVATFGDLVKLAERNGRMVLHHTNGERHSYYVQDADITYGYQITDQDDAAPTQGQEGQS